jgi:hypothetical protein
VAERLPEPEHEADPEPEAEPILRAVLVRFFCLTREPERETEVRFELGEEAAKRMKCDEEGVGRGGRLGSVLARSLVMVLVLPLVLEAPRPGPALGLLPLPLSN